MKVLLARLVPPAVRSIVFLGLVAPVIAQAPPPSGCDPEWFPSFGTLAGPNDNVNALEVFDDGSGSGPVLYVAGDFTAVFGQSAKRIAAWDGQSWSPLGEGLSNAVRALAVFGDGSGPALYAAGAFTTAGGQAANRVAKWDGQSWSALGSGLDNEVRALAVFDDGSGPALYAAGNFSTAGGQSANRIAKWDGQSWSALGSGIATPFSTVMSLAVFDDGSGAGPALFVGGNFTSAGGQSANRIAKWDGQGWSALGSGVTGTGGVTVESLAVFDDGLTGAALFAGGRFNTAGGQPANNLAKWDGQQWSDLGGLGGSVQALAVFDGGSGAPALYAGGYFPTAGGLAVSNIAKWDGQSWSALGGGVSSNVHDMTEFDDGSGLGASLLVGGTFSSAGGQQAKHIARWDGADWSALGKGGLNYAVFALEVFDDGSGDGAALYAGGVFTFAGALAVGGIARWNGHEWSSLGTGTDQVVSSLAAFDDGSGPALFAGGNFQSVGGQPAIGIARWDGQSWSSLPGLDSGVSALAVFDDGSGAGPMLYAAGPFTLAGSQPANCVAKWDGQTWSALGAGLNNEVACLAVFDDGSGAGPALFAGGFFTLAGGQPASRIAKWDGQTWSPVGGGMSSSELGDVLVECLTVFDDGSGPALYAGGEFTMAGGQSANRVAKWDGQAWSALGSGTNAPVWTLTVHDDGSGSGPALYAGGSFAFAGGQNAKRIARWDGQNWSALGSGIPGDSVWSLASFDGGTGTGPVLCAGGFFTSGPAGDSFIASWGCPAIDVLPGCFGNPAELISLSKERSIGSTLEVSLSASQFTTGLGVLYLGLEGADAAGCGFLVPGIGELLLALAPMPQPLGSGSLSAGALAFALPVPDVPSLVGVDVALQGVAVGAFEPGLPLELSNALLVTITQ